MKRRSGSAAWLQPWAKALRRLTRQVVKTGLRQVKPAVGRAAASAVGRARTPVKARRSAQPGAGEWIAGVAAGPAGLRRFRLYRPPDLRLGERLPLLVMLHGCGQDAADFAASTRMNLIARRKRFLVLYPEQDRLSNAQGCWNWFDTGRGRAHAEADLILQAVDQACLLRGADRQRVAVVGLSAGASMAALLVTRHPERFKALVMHSGVPPGLAYSGMSALGAMRGHRPRQSASRAAAAAAATATPEWPPLLVIHGAADGVVSPHNAQAAVQMWAAANAAHAVAPRRLQRGSRRAMIVTDYRRGRRSVATLALVDGLAHAWSGGAAGQPYSDALGPDASRMAWAFAERQFRR